MKKKMRNFVRDSRCRSLYRLCMILLGIAAGFAACGKANEPTITAQKHPTPASTPEEKLPAVAPNVEPTSASLAQPTTSTIPSQQIALDGEKLLKERCTQCHGLKKIDSAAHDRAGWEKTVDRMLDKRGGKVLNDAAERQAVIDYLTSR